MPTNKILKEAGIIIATFLISTLFLAFLTTKFHELTPYHIINDIGRGLDDLTVNSLPAFVFLAFLPYVFFLILRHLSKRKILIKKSIKILVSTLLFILYYFSISYAFDCQISGISGNGFFKGNFKVCFGVDVNSTPCFSKYYSVPNADLESFEVLGEKKTWDRLYAKDKNHVYYDSVIYSDGAVCADPLVYPLGHILVDADPNTFELLGNGYARDKNNFFKDGRILSIDQEGPLGIDTIDIEQTEWISLNAIIYKHLIIYSNISEIGVIFFAKLNPNLIKIEIQNSSKNPKTISEWASKDFQALINAAYFNEDGTPSGQLIIDRENLGKEIFDQDKSGLVAIKDNKLVIRDLSVEPLKPDESLDFALQSFPFLIKNYERAIETKSDNKARRSAIGIDKDGYIYLLVSDSEELSLYQFMNILEYSGIDFENVLNLDGGPSSGLYINFGRYSKLIDSQVEVPSVLKFSSLNK